VTLHALPREGDDMRKPIEEVVRAQLVEIPELDLEKLDRRVHLAPTVSGTVHALTGVASSDVDIVVTDDFFDPSDDRDVPIVAVARKRGKYDGQERDRLVLRRLPGHQIRDLPAATLAAEEYGSEVDVVVYSEDGSGDLWRGTYRLWTHQLTDISAAGRIVRWHWRRYYPFLSEADIGTYADGFGGRVVGLTISQANRVASRELYAISRAAGWRKLTLREQEALHLDGQWHRDEVVLARRADHAHRSGCGERTLLSASLAEHLEGWLDGRP
jgi:hypothetical protein